MQKIQGVIVYDLLIKEYSFKDFLEKDSFVNGSLIRDYYQYVYLCDHTIELEIPADFDLIKPQLEALDQQEDELKAKYQAALTQIKVKRNSLLAIENKPSA